MRSWLTLLATVFVGSTLSLSAMEARSFLEFDAAYRHDSASWKFIVPSPDPILSDKVSFKDINIFQIGLEGKTMIDCSCYNLFVRARADYGWILDGDVEQTLRTYGPEDVDNVIVGSSREVKNILDGKYVADLSIAIGVPCYFCDCTLSVAPVLGYSYATQHYKVDLHERPFFVAPTTPGNPPTIDVEEDCCTNTFVNSWYGPFLGVDLYYAPDACLSFYGQFEYHWAHFTGRRNSNVDVSAIDHHHSSTKKAHGAFVKLGLNYMFSDCWYAGFNATYQDFRNHKSSNVGNELAVDGLLPELVAGRDDNVRSQVKWKSVAFGVAVGKTF